MKVVYIVKLIHYEYCHTTMLPYFIRFLNGQYISPQAQIVTIEVSQVLCDYKYSNVIYLFGIICSVELQVTLLAYVCATSWISTNRKQVREDK